MVDMDKTCEGCLTYEEQVKDLTRCTVCGGYKTKDFDCPCQRCLVKFMCVVPCETLKKRYWKGLNLIKELSND